jgi:hypothetical protein
VPDFAQAPSFVQSERRSFLVPILLALAAIGVAIALAIHFFPATTVNITHVHTDVVPTETVFKGSTIIGLTDTQRMLYVVSKVKIDNQLRVPIYTDNVHLTYTTPDNAELVVLAVEKNDLPDLLTNYPALKPLVTAPLLHNTEIDAGKSAEGTVVFGLKIPQEMWEQRQSAVIKVELYHQPAIYVTIPK